MKNRHLWLLGVLLPIAVIVSVWIPPLSHYWVPSPSADQALLNHLHNWPAASQLLEIEHQNLALPLKMTDAEILEAATRLRSGELALKGYPPVAVSLGFDSVDLRKGLPTWGLHFGSLAATVILTRAYEITGDDTWLSAALKHTVGFIEYERTAWLPEGFLWNDHAISGRISALIKLWRVYRNHPDYSPETGRILIDHVLRCRNLLAKDSHFTFNTNHGVMQNISLLQIAGAFPGLPEETRYRKLAAERLDRQFGFYVSNEGVVLEHSAEYHALGIELIGMSMRLLQILGEPVPPRWGHLYRESNAFFDMIRLPDNSLPMFGNTNSMPEFPPGRHNAELGIYERSSCPQKQGTHLYPVAGYAVIWTCSRQSTQTLLALSQFIGHGHKHADELSMLTWTRGSRWLTNVGYWPYGVPGDEYAYGWEGSNAPHWIREPTNGEREPLLYASGVRDGITFLDALRKGKDGTEFRRQILQIGEDWWIVLDFSTGPANTQGEVLWTFFPGISLNPHGDNSYLASMGENEMLVNIGGTGDISHRIIMAEQSPWRGWVVKDRVPTPAETVLAQFSAGSPLISSFRAADKDKSRTLKMKLVAHQGPEAWELAIDIASTQAVSIKREPDGHIELTGFDGFGNTRLVLTPAPDIKEARTAIRSSYSSLEAEFARYREVFGYRLKVTKLLLLVFAVQEILLALVWVYRRHLFSVLRLSEMLTWISGGLTLHMWYFP